MEIHHQSSNPSPFYRFQIYQGERTTDESRIEKKKVVGMAYLKEGQTTYTVRLWTFLRDRFYLVQSKHDPSRYLLMTREPNLKPGSKNKYFWNIVGNAQVDSRMGHMQINFDLLSQPIYMNIFPESSATSSTLPEPETFEDAA